MVAGPHKLDKLGRHSGSPPKAVFTRDDICTRADTGVVLERKVNCPS